MPVALIIHGGAGAADPDSRGQREQGLRLAFAAGWNVLSHNGRALDAVISAVAVLEDDPVFNAGLGSCLTQDGTVELDASVMDGAAFRVGAVGAVAGVRNPVRLARAVLEDGRHAFMVGPGAWRFARERAVPTLSAQSLITARQYQRWRTGRGAATPGTVGAVAQDTAGNLAAATSTGGLVYKRSGRVGDSAIIGAGTYADNGLGGCSATGDGEAILRTTLARTAVELLGGGREPGWAAQTALQQLAHRTGGEAGLILIDGLGRIGYAYTTPTMSVALSVERQVQLRVA